MAPHSVYGHLTSNGVGCGSSSGCCLAARPVPLKPPELGISWRVKPPPKLGISWRVKPCSSRLYSMMAAAVSLHKLGGQVTGPVRIKVMVMVRVRGRQSV